MNTGIIEKLNKLQTEELKALGNYRQEIMIMESQLADVAVADHAIETRNAIDNFKDQFALHQNNIDELRNWINEHTQQVGREAMLNGGQIKPVRFEEQNILTEEYRRVEKQILELSKDFNRFLTTYQR